MAISRREALQLSGLAVAATAVAGCSTSNNPQAETKSKTTDYKAPIADTTKPRVVLVGGGGGGSSNAKKTKKYKGREQR